MVKLVGQVSSSKKSIPSELKNMVDFITCSGCNKLFPNDEIMTYYSKNYCPACLNDEKEKRKKKKASSKKKNKVNQIKISPDVVPAQYESKNNAILEISFPELKRNFLKWVKELDPDEYTLQSALINRIQKQNRTSFAIQSIELFWEFLQKQKSIT